MLNFLFKSHFCDPCLNATSLLECCRILFSTQMHLPLRFTHSQRVTAVISPQRLFFPQHVYQYVYEIISAGQGWV